ncbi:hypothetical protein ACW2Q0_30240 [Nocardia sp. R16R-3T]
MPPAPAVGAVERVALTPYGGQGLREVAMSWDVDQQWHQVLSERNRLRDDLEAVADALRRHHDDRHVGSMRWCDAPVCQLLFRLDLLS